MFETGITYFVLFSGGLSILFSVGQLLVKFRRLANYNLSVMFLCLGLCLMQLAFINNGMVFIWPWIFTFHLSFLYILTPLLYYAYYLVILPEENLSRKSLLLLIPTLAAFAADLVFLQMQSGEKKQILDYLFNGTNAVSSIYIKILFAAAGVQMIVYLGVLFMKIISLWDIKEQPPVVRTTMAYVVLSISVVVMLAAGYMLGSMQVLRCGMLLTSIMMVFAYLVGQRQPKFLQLLMVEAEKRRYGHSLLEGMDFNAVGKRLDTLMDQNKMYRDENITLGSLAEALSITHHQLSQLLNEKFKMNFSTFINGYRIRDAKKMIIEEPESSIISVAYVVGFNSKTAFYRAFDKATGMTPQKYRDEILEKS